MDLIPKYFFNDPFDDLFELTDLKNNHFMRTDITEKNGEYIIEMEIPGFAKEDVSIEYNKGYLSIKAKKEEEKKDDKKYIRHERFYSEYQRSFYIGEIDEDEIRANFEDGILKITFPKNDKMEKKTIEIE